MLIKTCFKYAVPKGIAHTKTQKLVLVLLHQVVSPQRPHEREGRMPSVDGIAEIISYLRKKKSYVIRS